MIAQVVYDKLDDNVVVISKTLRRIPLITDIIFTKGNEFSVRVNGIKVWDSRVDSIKELEDKVYDVGIKEELSKFIFPISS